jgi:hypothetical protein
MEKDMGYSSDRAQLNDELVAKAMKDNAFRQQLVSDPKGTIEREYGVTLSPDTNIHIHDETARDLHIVLPAAPSATTELQSEEADAADCSGWSSVASCTLECTQCGNNGTTCAPGPTEEGG